MEQIKEYEYVDLGLPSGLKWAKCNVGAEKETDDGYYFQWGEITPYTDYTWADYKYCNDSSTTMTKYCTDSLNGTVDNKTKLEDEDNAARANMGGDWRMPTSDECEELINNTINEWISDYKGTGVSGRKFTSKTDTSKYIFFPAAGGCYQRSAYDVGYYGDVWSSSLNISNPYSAWYLVFNSVNCSMADSAAVTTVSLCVEFFKKIYHNMEKIKIIAIISNVNGGFAYVLNRDIEYTYTKIDEDTIIGEDEGVIKFYKRDDSIYPFGKMAFGGRKFTLKLSDGTEEKCHGQWWDGMSKTARELYDYDNIVDFPSATIDELRQIPKKAHRL